MKARTFLGVTQSQRLALSGSLHTALQILRMDAGALSAYLEDQAAELPALTTSPALPTFGEWLPRWSGFGLGGLDFLTADLPSQGSSLVGHVVDALPRLVPDKADYQIALALADALEPSGWLGRGTDDIAADLGVSPEAVTAVLLRLQKIEPAGLFARDLKECLRLQAVEAGVLDPTLSVLLDHLPLAAAGEWDRLAALSGASMKDLRHAFATLRSFDPKPGTGFSTLSSPVREPDLTVRITETGWSVELNRSSLPTLSIDPKAPGAAQARALLRLVESRNASLLQVARAVLAHQAPALEKGPAALRPLTMQAVADELSLHKSTISRLVAGSSVDTPFGTWWLRALFSPDMGGDLGAAALRARLAQIVAAEDKAEPLSDDALADALSEGGPVIARRTVAKYRASLRIPPAFRRRQRASSAGGPK